MNGPIAQAAALTLYGTQHLHGRPWSEFWPGAHVFKYCKHVRFRDGEQVDADPAAWFAALSAGGIRQLRLHRVAGKQAIAGDRELSAFVGGGGRWLIEAQSATDSVLWEAQWRTGPRDEHGAIWEVDYGRIAGRRPHIILPHAMPEALRTSVRTTLGAIESFARRQKLDGFAASFEAAQHNLDADAPLQDVWGGDFGHATLLPPVARQLIAAAATAWVFGGMGSWNDQGFESAADRAEYKRLSDSLFAKLCESICAAVNSTPPLA